MTPKAVVNAMEARINLTGGPRQLRDAIERELLAGGYGPAAAAEAVDRICQKVTLEITKRADDAKTLGNLSTLQLRGKKNDVVHGSSYVFDDDPEPLKSAKLGRVFANDIYRHMKDLTFPEFERFGRSVLRELGCKTVKVTPHAGDQGIDFYGELTVGALLGAHEAILRLMHETRVVLVGQAKHYHETKNPVGPSTVRELVGALSLARTYTYSRDDLDLLDDVQLRPFTPVLALLFTTGEFTKGARHLARRAGLIAFSGWQLAVFLADKRVGLVGDDSALRFDSATFTTWLG